MRALLVLCCSLALSIAAPQNPALAEAQAAVEKNPKDAGALLTLGALYDRAGQFERAAPILERAVKAAPSMAAARMELAVCLARLHRYKEAAVTLDPVAPPKDTPQLLLYRRLKASIASGNKDDATAADEMAKALEIAPGDRGLAVATAVAQFRAGRLDQALASSEKSKAIQDSADIENLLGDIQERRGDSLAAVHGYQTAVALAPDNEEYRLSLALELLRHHTFEPAILVLEQGSKQFPASLRMRVALALGYFLVNRDSDATAALLGAMRLESGRAFVLDFLGDLLIDQSDTPDNGVVKEICGDADAHTNSAMAQAVCGGLLLRVQADQADDAHNAEPLARLRKAVQLAGDNATARCQLGKALEMDQQWKDARQEMEECVRLRPDSTEWHYRLSRIYLRLGLGDLAKEQDRLRAEADQKLAAQSQQRYATLAQFLYALGSKSEP
jgi:tetratricopeptide (TPR) repeat protein